MATENLSDRNVINSIKEMVLDEEKIVTYVSLSKDFCIHVNSSKMLLSSALEKIRKEQTNLQLNINYIVSGLSDINMGRTTVCLEQDLDRVRSKFKTIFYEHVYSISKGIPNNAAVLLVNKFEDFGLCKGYIKCSDCVKHTTTDISCLKNSKIEVKKVDSKPLAGSIKKVKLEPKETATEISNNYKEQKTTDPKIKLEPCAKSEITTPKQQSNGKQNNLKMQKGIAGFLNKPMISSSNKSTSNMKNAVQDTDKNKDIKVEKKMDDEEPEIIKEPCKNKTEKENTNVILKKISKTLNQKKKSLKVDLNRKRVLQVSDSESEEDTDPFTPDKQKVLEDSDDEIPPTPMANNIKIKAALVNPKKKRKIVDKTFMDEEGYILTKKVEVYESCSENEEDVLLEKKEKHVEGELPKLKVNEIKVEKSPKKNGPKNKKKAFSPQKSKQATLTNFFKRK